MRYPSWVTAAQTIAVAALSFCSVYALSMWLQAGPNAAILAAVLALSFARRRAEGTRHPWIWELASILLVGIAAGVVDWLLHTYFWIGAVVFTVTLFLSVWLRRFGTNMRQLGRVMALPFIAVLIAPGVPHAAGGPWVDLLLLLSAAVIAFAWDELLLVLTRKSTDQAVFEPPARSTDSGTMPASTRMAAQMGVALAAAFLLGHFLFPTHWGWVVLTAFIVCSGAIGRGDAAYKGVLRFGGALLGALAAAGLEYVFVPHGPLVAVLIFAALFVGTWLREANYAWWAACVTLVVALLSGSTGASVTELLGQRLLAITLGAICGVAACWFVLPITTRSVVRRRVADALLALEELAAATDAEREQKLEAVRRCALECERIAPPLRWYKRLIGCGEEHPAVWLQLMQSCTDKLPSQADPELVKAVRLTRKALKDDRGIAVALRKVQIVLEA
jgi:hypothetical protein